MSSQKHFFLALDRIGKGETSCQIFTAIWGSIRDNLQSLHVLPESEKFYFSNRQKRKTVRGPSPPYSTETFVLLLSLD